MKSQGCKCGHSIKSHRGYDKDAPLMWMILNLGPCRVTYCPCDEFRLDSLPEL